MATTKAIEHAKPFKNTEDRYSSIRQQQGFTYEMGIPHATLVT